MQFRYVLVDEYQDTNFAQHSIVLQLTQENQRVCVVGDDAQSIYSFRGANIALKREGQISAELSVTVTSIRDGNFVINFLPTRTAINVV